MKKLLFFLLVFTAQSALGQNFSFGLKAGANLNQWYFKPVLSESGIAFSYDKAISYELGLTGTQKLNKKLNLNGEVLYTQRNTIFHYKLPSTNPPDKFGFIAVPLFLSYNVYKPLSIDFGGEYSRVLNSNSFFIKNMFTHFNFGSALVGLRYRFLKNFNVHARYIHPFTSLSTIEWTDFNANPLVSAKLYARTFSLAVGYSF